MRYGEDLRIGNKEWKEGKRKGEREEEKVRERIRSEGGKEG